VVEKMFQNIVKEETMDNENIEDKIKRTYDIKSLFSVQNIILYAISCMVSMVSFNGEIAPFAFAMFASSCSSGIPAGIVYIACLIGTAIGFGTRGTISYIITTLIFIGMILVFKPKYKYFDEERNEKQKLGIYLFISVLIVQIGKMLLSMFLMYDLLIGIIAATTAYIFYKIFSNSLVVIKEYGVKKAFSIEEVIGASLVLSVAVASLSNLKVFELSITNILSVMLVLFLGWQNGMLAGATGGITIGMVLGIMSNSNPILIAAFAISRNACGSS
jgi:stage II sporulation protein E